MKPVAIEAVPAPDSGADREEIEAMLAAIAASVLRVGSVAPDEDLFELGADSLTAVELMVAIEKAFGIALPIETLWARAATVAELAALLSVDSAPADPCPVDLAIGERRDIPTITARDPALAVLLIALYGLSYAVPERNWQRASARLARLIAIASRGRTERQARRLADLLVGHCPDRSWNALARDIEANGIEQRIHMLRRWDPERGRPPVRLAGEEHIEAALAEGKGAILWLPRLAFTGLAVSAAVTRAGYGVGMISRDRHGFSTSHFAQAFLNPIAIRSASPWIEDRIVVDGDGQAALALVVDRLKDNRLVAIEANAGTDRPVTVPFLGGETVLSAGPARLARATGAALLPAFHRRDPDGGFTAVIEPALEADPLAEPHADADARLHRFVERLEHHCRAAPEMMIRWT